jgi:hypothetical protein
MTRRLPLSLFWAVTLTALLICPIPTTNGTFSFLYLPAKGCVDVWHFENRRMDVEFSFQARQVKLPMTGSYAWFRYCAVQP